MALYLISNKFGWVESPVVYEDIRKCDTVIAEFHSDLFYTAEENFDRFADYVKSQEGRPFSHYSAQQLKELHTMWLESL